MRSMPRRAVTLVELLILLIVLGAIALYARTRFAETPVQRREATLKASLREVVDAQQEYFIRHTHYARTMDSLPLPPRSGITIVVDSASELGWRATARAADLPARSCTVWYGAPEGRSGGEGVPVCGADTTGRQGVPGARR